MKWIVEAVPEINGYAVEWAEPRNFYLSRRNVLFHSETLRPPFTKIATIDAPAWKQLASKLRLTQRLLRFMVTNVIPLEGGSLFVTFDKSVGIIRDGRYQELKGLYRPCRVLRSACTPDANGTVYFGEYLANTERGEMRIYRYSGEGNELETAYVFAAGSIRHIHGLYYDKFTESIFCLTGDDEKECQILQTFDGFNKVNVIGSGDETWRAVSVLFSEDSIYYGMDAEFRTNHLYRLTRQNGERKSLGKVNGTVFYSKQVGKDMFFTTTAENAPSQVANVAALWHIGQDGKCEELVSFKKDFWHPSLFMFGTIHFPYHNGFENELFFHLVAVDGDNQTYRAHLV